MVWQPTWQAGTNKTLLLICLLYFTCNYVRIVLCEDELLDFIPANGKLPGDLIIETNEADQHLREKRDTGAFFDINHQRPPRPHQPSYYHEPPHHHHEPPHHHHEPPHHHHEPPHHHHEPPRHHHEPPHHHHQLPYRRH